MCSKIKKVAKKRPIQWRRYPGRTVLMDNPGHQTRDEQIEMERQ
jgi:hypothetical protein